MVDISMLDKFKDLLTVKRDRPPFVEWDDKLWRVMGVYLQRFDEDQPWNEIHEHKVLFFPSLRNLPYPKWYEGLTTHRLSESQVGHMFRDW